MWKSGDNFQESILFLGIKHIIRFEDKSPGPLQVASVSLLTSYCFTAQMPIVFLIVCQHLHLLSSKEHNIFFILHAVLFWKWKDIQCKGKQTGLNFQVCFLEMNAFGEFIQISLDFLCEKTYFKWVNKISKGMDYYHFIG